MHPIEIPPGAADCHVHVIDPARFPFAPDASYRPIPAECGTAEDLASTLDTAGIERVVVVNPSSGYGDDNRCTQDALERLGPRARGIARVPLDIPDAELRALARRGIVGVRIDVVGLGLALVEAADFGGLMRRLADRDMVAQVQGEGGQWPAIVAALERAAPVRVVVDHAGRPSLADGLDAPAFEALLRLAQSGRVAVKLSGAMRFSREPRGYADTDPFFAAIVRTFPATHLVWGSDWPFVRSDRRVDYGPKLAHLARVLPDAQARRQVLCESPARWFGFPPP
jgi:predicted TIM-barrel fold metal-dependent hydrolase